MPNFKGRNSERSERDRKAKLDEEFNFESVHEAEDRYGGSYQRNEPKPKTTEQGEDRVKKAKTKTWSNVVKGLKEDELEKANSDKSGNGSETADSVEEFDSDEPNHLKVKRPKGWWKRCQHHDSKGVDKGLTNRQADREGRGTRNRTGRAAQARRGDARKSLMLTQEEPQVELEGEC